MPPNGFDVNASLQARHPGRDDVEVVGPAFTEQRIAPTHDRDLGERAIARREAFTGIVDARLGHVDAAFAIGSLDAPFAEDPDVEIPFIVVVQRDGAHVRIGVRHL